MTTRGKEDDIFFRLMEKNTARFYSCGAVYSGKWFSIFVLIRRHTWMYTYISIDVREYVKQSSIIPSNGLTALRGMQVCHGALPFYTEGCTVYRVGLIVEVWKWIITFINTCTPKFISMPISLSHAFHFVVKIRCRSGCRVFGITWYTCIYDLVFNVNQGPGRINGSLWSKRTNNRRPGSAYTLTYSASYTFKLVPGCYSEWKQRKCRISFQGILTGKGVLAKRQAGVMARKMFIKD